MRPQQNRRIRGRNNNNNRRGPNPLSRNYESNGPEVKIRGNAQHIADKYTALARDAQAAGDRVMAENYLQHAEHYVRIILAAQAQMPQPVQRDDLLEDEDEENTTIETTDQNEDQETSESDSQSDIEGVSAETKASDNDTAAGEFQESKRPRRISRRRMNSARNTGSENSTNDDEDQNASIEDANNNTSLETDGENEIVEKKPRRRRTVKQRIEEAEEEA